MYNNRKYPKSVFRELQDFPYSKRTRRAIFNSTKGSEDFVQRLKLLKRLPIHNGCVNCICWNEKGNKILSGSDDQHLVVSDPFTYQVLAQYRTNHRANIFSAKFLPNSGDTGIVSCSGDGSILYTDLCRLDETQDCLFNCHVGTTYDVVTIPNDPNLFLSCGEDYTVRSFDLRIKNKCTKAKCKEDVIIQCRRAVTALTVNSLMPCQIAIGCADSTVRLYDRRMVQGVNTRLGAVESYIAPGLERKSYRITSLNFSPEGDDLLVSYSSEHVYMFGLRNCGDTGEVWVEETEGGSEEEEDLGVWCSSSTAQDKADSVPVRRLRLRGDWSDTGPDARPHANTSSPTSQGGRRVVQGGLIQRMTDVLSRMLNDPATRAALSHGGDPEPSDQMQLEEGLGEYLEVNGRRRRRRTSSQDRTPSTPNLRSLSAEDDPPLDQEGESSMNQSDLPSADDNLVSMGHEGRTLSDDGQVMAEDVTVRSLVEEVTMEDTTVGSQVEEVRMEDVTVGSQAEEVTMEDVSVGSQAEEVTMEEGGEVRVAILLDLSEPPVQAPSPPVLLHSSSPTLSIDNSFISCGDMPDVERSLLCQSSSQLPLQSESVSTLDTDVSGVAMTKPQRVSALDGASETTGCLSPSSFSPCSQSASSPRLTDVHSPCLHFSPGHSDLLPDEPKRQRKAQKLDVEGRNNDDQWITAEPCASLQGITEQSVDHIQAEGTQPSILSPLSQPTFSPDNLNTFEGQSVEGEPQPGGSGTSTTDAGTSATAPGTAATSNLLDLKDEISTIFNGFKQKYGKKPMVKMVYSARGSTASTISMSMEDQLSSPPNTTSSNSEETVAPEVRSEDQGDGFSGLAEEEVDTRLSQQPEEPTPSTSSQPAPSTSSMNTKRRLMEKQVAKALRDARGESSQDEGVRLRKAFVRMKYTGHRNARTMIKEATFWGSDYVMSGSDCGHVFIWCRHTGRLVMTLQADNHVVNCLQPHPTLPILATSGIDYDLKLWSPLAYEPSFDLPSAHELMNRNAIMLEETKDTITVPASFMIRMLACLNQLRRGGPRAMRRRRQPDD